MGFVLGGEDLTSLFFRFHRFEGCFSLHAVDLLYQILLCLLGILITILHPLLSSLKLLLHLLPGFPCLDISDHAVKVSEKGLRVIIYITFLFSINTEIICLLNCSFVQVRGLTAEVLEIESHHDFGDVFEHLFDERSDGFGFWIEFVETAEVSDKFDELVMNLSLILRFSLLFINLSVKHSEEFRFEKHLVKRNEYLQYKL